MSTFELDEVCKLTPPEFGHETLKYFPFDPEYTNLNNGSFGSLPLPVLAECNKETIQIERNPDFFLRFTHYTQYARAREQVSKVIGAQPEECVLVPNASHGLNTVLRNIEWENGDIIVGFSTTYSSISRTIQYLSDAPPHPSVASLVVSFPSTHADLISAFETHIKLVVSSKPPGKKVVAVIDSIVANPGVFLPWKEMVKICKSAGVYSVVDAAHSIGQETNINLSEADPDFWVSNCHKWLFAKRGCAVLYVPKRNQHLIKSSIPTSHSYVTPAQHVTFVEQFEWNGTVDFVPLYSVIHAIRFREWLGGEAKINAYCHSLAIAGGRRLAEILGTSVMDPDGSLTLNMVNVELPLSSLIEDSLETKVRLQQKLLGEHQVYSAHYKHNGRWWTRCSAQIFNELSDFEKLGRAWLQVCKEVNAEFDARVMSKL